MLAARSAHAARVRGGMKGAVSGSRVAVAPVSARRVAAAPAAAPATRAEGGDRLRLHNLSPQPGSTKANRRLGRGYGSGQGGTCGKGNRGQKVRSGRGIRPGFEGGQTPMYRQLPKLKGICGGMPAGRTKYVTVNVGELAALVEAGKLPEGEEITLSSLKSAGAIKAQGKMRNLPLKVLAGGETDKPLKVAAVAFSEAAKSKLEAAGGEAVEVAGRAKWTRAAHEAAKAAA